MNTTVKYESGSQDFVLTIRVEVKHIERDVYNYFWYEEELYAGVTDDALPGVGLNCTIGPKALCQCHSMDGFITLLTDNLISPKGRFHSKKLKTFIERLSEIPDPCLISSVEIIGNDVYGTHDSYIQKYYYDCILDKYICQTEGYTEYSGRISNLRVCDESVEITDSLTYSKYTFAKDRKQRVLDDLSCLNRQTAGKLLAGDTEVRIADSVHSVMEDAFIGFSGMQSLCVSENVRYIAPSTFLNCRNLKEVTVCEGNSYLTVTDDTVINRNGEVVKIHPSFATDIPAKRELDDAATKITSCNDKEFRGNKKLTSIHIDSISVIGKECFKNCINLKSVWLSDTVTEIKASAFEGCTNLEYVYLSDSVRKIGNYGFKNCKKLEYVTIPQGVKRLSDKVFAECDALKAVQLPSTIESMGNYAFGKCSSLMSFTLPPKLKKMGYGVFGDCHNLQSIDIDPANKTFIRYDGMVLDKEKTGIYFVPVCKEWEDLRLPKTVKTVTGNNANVLSHVIFEGTLGEFDNIFADTTILALTTSDGAVPEDLVIDGGTDSVKLNNCAFLKSVTVSENVPSFRIKSLRGCKNLSSVIVKGDCSTIGSFALSDCDNLVSVTICGNCGVIECNAFSHCAKLTNITIQGNCGDLKDFIDYKSDALNTIHIQGNCGNIGWCALCACKQLIIDGDCKSIQQGACDKVSSITIKGHCEEMGDNCFSGGKHLDRITIEGDCDRIHDNAFFGCDHAVVSAPAGSNLERYAKEKGIHFQAL